MSAEIKENIVADQTLDTRGMGCPLPLLKEVLNSCLRKKHWTRKINIKRFSHLTSADR